MLLVRPTIKAIQGLPRESFIDPTMFDVASTHDEAKMLEQLRLFDLVHPLLVDASRQVATTKLSTHQSCTSAADRPVYEARQTDGAAWRGAFIRDGDNWWLVYSDKHDKFNSRAKKFLKRSRSAEWMPSDQDYDVLDAENGDLALRQWRTTILRTLVEAICEASTQTGTPSSRAVPGKPDLPDHPPTSPIADIRATVFHNDDLVVDPTTAHTTDSILEVELSITDSRDREQADQLRNELVQVCIPYLGVAQEDLHSLFKKNGALSVTAMITHAKLLQLAQDPDTANPDAVQSMAPSRLHYASKTTITAGYITGSTVVAICGFTFVPTRDEYTAAELPICEECENASPSDPILMTWQPGPL